MPVIVFSSPKGGVGKTTAAVILASELAVRGASVTVIDADPNLGVVEWAQQAATPESLNVVQGVSEETILDLIEAATVKSQFVVVDLEGTASLIASYAISMADLVIIPVQGSHLDAKQAARQISLVKAQERIARREIPYAVLFTRTNPAIVPKTFRHIEQQFAQHNVVTLGVHFADREPYRAIFSFGGTLDGLSDKGMSNLPAALANAHALVAEVIERLRAGQGAEAQKEVA